MSTDNVRDEVEAVLGALGDLSDAADVQVAKIDEELRGQRETLGTITRGSRLALQHVTDRVDDLTHERAQLAPPAAKPPASAGDTTAAPATPSGHPTRVGPDGETIVDLTGVNEPPTASPPAAAVAATARPAGNQRLGINPLDWEWTPWLLLLALLGAVAGIIVASNTWDDFNNSTAFEVVWYFLLAGVGFYAGACIYWLFANRRRRQ